jgi:hypothetical protein
LCFAQLTFEIFICDLMAQMGVSVLKIRDFVFTGARNRVRSGRRQNSGEDSGAHN